MRKLLLSAFVLALCANAAKAIETDANGVYLIATAQDLVDFAAIVNGTHSSIEQNTSASAVVTADIDMSSTSYTPIGISDEYPYAGTFDGGNHTITLNSSNVSSGNMKGTGLFGQAGTCTIENITVDGSVGVYSTTEDVGGIVGSVPTGTATITNCHNKASIGAHYKAGGIVGVVEKGDGVTAGGAAIITNCTNSGGIKSSAQWCGSGGIVGLVYDNAGGVTLENCINTGSVSDPESAGGLVGSAKAAITVKNCANKGEVSGSATVGTLVGYLHTTATIENCYNAYTSSSSKFFGSINSSATTTITNCYDINGTCADNGVTAFTSAELTSGALCYNLNGGDTNDAAVWRQTVGEGYPTFSGSIVYAYYENCTTAERTYTNTVPTSTHLTIGHSFGSDGNCVFCGKSATDAEYFLTGAEVDNATVAVTVTRDGETATLINGSSTAKAGETLSLTVTPANGYYFSDATNAAKTLTVELTTAMVSDGKIDVSSALKDYAVHQHEYGTDGKCTTCQALKTYTLATPPTSTYVVSTVVKRGGTELAVGATLTYGDVLSVEVTKQSYAVWSNSYTGETQTFEITVGNTDPNDDIAAKVALAVCPHTDQTGGVCDRCGYYSALTSDNMVDGYYQIATAGDLMAFADIVNGTNGATKNAYAKGKVTADIDFTNITVVSYTPIGYSNPSGIRYNGTFDGDGHTITLNINNAEEHQGLFGYTGSGCTIENVTVAGTIKSTESYVGGIVGCIYNSTTISNCTNKANVSGKHAGGIVGRIWTATANIKGCTNKGNVTSSNSGVGGIVAYSSGYGNTITKCVNEGALEGNSGYVGGIVGRYNGSSSALSIEDCANRGSITFTGSSTSGIGSLVGYAYAKSITLTACYNSAESSYPALGNTSTTSGTLTITRCYDVNSTSTEEENAVLKCTADEIKSGALCFKLNGGMEDLAWYQKIGTDNYPVLTAEEKETNVVNYILKGTDGTYFNTGSEATVANTDPTTFCYVDEIVATETAKSNLDAKSVNMPILNGEEGYTCANAVLVDGTDYTLGGTASAVATEFKATKFTYERGNLPEGISTFVLPVAVSTSSVNGTVYILSSYDEAQDLLKFEEVEAANLEAHTPYLVKTAESGKSLLDGTLSDVEVLPIGSPEEVTKGNATHEGSYCQQTGDASTDTQYSYYGYTDGKFLKTTGTWTLNPFRTRIKISGTSSAKAIALSLGGEVTGIVSPELESVATDVYTTGGIKVRSGVSSATALQGLPADIYIVGGKKVTKH